MGRELYPIFLIEKLDFVRFCLAEAVAFVRIQSADKKEIL